MAEDSITNSMDMNLSKLQEIVKDRGAWCAAMHGNTKGQTWLSNWTTTKMYLHTDISIYFCVWTCAHAHHWPQSQEAWTVFSAPSPACDKCPPFSGLQYPDGRMRSPRFCCSMNTLDGSWLGSCRSFQGQEQPFITKLECRGQEIGQVFRSTPAF